jgi:hypothetical protein
MHPFLWGMVVGFLLFAGLIGVMVVLGASEYPRPREGAQP